MQLESDSSHESYTRRMIIKHASLCFFSQTIDSLLASLVSMGFELDRCQAAVNCGKLTVNEAIEW